MSKDNEYRVKTMVTKAFDNDLLSGHVLKAFRKVKRKLKRGVNARKRIVTFDEYAALVNTSPAHMRGILIVAFNTGLRSGELRTLEWSHVDRRKMFIRLPAEVAKEKKPKNIPINYQVKEVLDNLPRALHNDYVFTYNGKPLLENAFIKAFARICRKAGIPYGGKTTNGVIFHDIRRTVKTNMLNAGIDKAHRDIILGHSLQGMDVYYLAPNEETLKQAMDQYTEWLDGQLAVANVD